MVLSKVFKGNPNIKRISTHKKRYAALMNEIKVWGTFTTSFSCEIKILKEMEMCRH